MICERTKVPPCLQNCVTSFASLMRGKVVLGLPKPATDVCHTWVRPGVCQQLCIIVCHVGGVYTLIDSLVLPGGPAESEAATGS